MPLKFLNDETKKKRKGMSKWENRGGGGGGGGGRVDVQGKPGTQWIN